MGYVNFTFKCRYVTNCICVDIIRREPSNVFQVCYLQKSIDTFAHSLLISRAHSDALSVRQAVKQSRSSRGLFSFFSRSKDGFHPTVNYKSSGNSACRIWGSLEVKKVTGMHASNENRIGTHLIAL